MAMQSMTSSLGIISEYKYSTQIDNNLNNTFT